MQKGAGRQGPGATAREAKYWAAAQLGARRSQVRFRRLRGGVEGTTWLATTRRPDGVRSGVLRLDDRADSETARLHASWKTSILASLADSGLPAASLIASHPDLRGSGPVAYLTSRLPGVASLPVDFRPRRSEAAGEMLARIHLLSEPFRSRLSGIGEAWWMRLRDVAETETGHDSRYREQWSLVRAALDSVNLNESVVLHGDYWMGNLLWRRDRLTGVIDWGSGPGPSGADVGYARLDQWLWYGPDGVASLSDAYAAVRGGLPEDLWFWDLVLALFAAKQVQEWPPGLAELGRVDLTVPTLADRVDLFIADAWERAGSRRR